MICISVSPKSRQLARVDILNAARQADMVEVCLDNLLKEPDVGDMLEGVTLAELCRRTRLLAQVREVPGPDYMI